MTLSSLERPDDHELIGRWQHLHQPTDLEEINWRWMPLVMELTRPYRKHLLLHQDQAAMWRFESYVLRLALEALENFDPDRKVRWITHLHSRLLRCSRFVYMVCHPGVPEARRPYMICPVGCVNPKSKTELANKQPGETK